MVARNLVAGRGWVVDYVTQFYKLYSGVTRAQETWPLLQPVWIAPFFALLGAEAWVAKIPNLIFMSVLGLLVYAAGARLWDRRVGLTAAVVVLTSHLFFKLVLYTTTDLAFVVFSFGAIYLLYRATTDDRRPTTDDRRPTTNAGSRFLVLGSWFSVLGSGLLTGLMLLQKPGSGVIMAGGMGLWFLAQQWRRYRANGHRGAAGQEPIAPVLNSSFSILHLLAPVAVWSALALLILSPYVVRSLQLFGTPFYSTESRDAWVQAYTNDWEIYKVYTPDADLGETGGLPDATWVLRWGFDKTLRKIDDQLVATRDYLLPPWSGLPLNPGRDAVRPPRQDAAAVWHGRLAGAGRARRAARAAAAAEPAAADIPALCRVPGALLACRRGALLCDGDAHGWRCWPPMRSGAATTASRRSAMADGLLWAWRWPPRRWFWWWRPPGRSSARRCAPSRGATPPISMPIPGSAPGRASMARPARW